MKMSVQRATSGAAMNTPENVVSRFTFSSATAPVDSNRRPDRRMDPIYEEQTAESASIDRHTYDEPVGNGREESALLSSHSPIPSVDPRQGRKYEPRRFYEFNDDNEAHLV